MLDLEPMTDMEIKQYKMKLWQLRRDATPSQDRELRAEMIRAQEVISRRQRERAVEYQRIAEETPGAVSARISGVTAGAGAIALTKGD